MAKERDNRQKQREALEKEEEELSAQVVKLKDSYTVTLFSFSARAKMWFGRVTNSHKHDFSFVSNLQSS